MARNKLKDTQIRSVTAPGRLSDGDGLYLSTSKTGSRSWVFMYTRAGKRSEIGLGSYGAGTGFVSLADARTKADEIRTIIGRGGDPLEEMRAKRNAETVRSFGEVADAYINGMESQWRNAKHRDQWRMTLGDAYCKALRKIDVSEVSTEDVLAVLKPIWTNKAETASRIRGRIENVLDHAKARGWRTGENPARWKGHLSLILPRQKAMKRGHHPAMPYADVPAFMVKLRKLKSASAAALEFAILTAARTEEVIGATWGEIAGKIWTVPAERMKPGREHRVPLVDRATEILEVMRKRNVSDSPYIFPGAALKRPLSNMAMTMVLRGLDDNGFTVHGFRSSFRDWAYEETHHQREIAEAALSHTVGDDTERAYRRGDALEKRRKLMEDWERYLGGGDG